jgi:hypothetical protein
VAEPPPCKLLAFAPKLLVFRHGGAPSLPAASGCFLGSEAIFFYRVQKATLEIECLRQSPMKPSGVVFQRGGATSLQAACFCCKAIGVPAWRSPFLASCFRLLPWIQSYLFLPGSKSDVRDRVSPAEPDETFRGGVPAWRSHLVTSCFLGSKSYSSTGFRKTLAIEGCLLQSGETF